MTATAESKQRTKLIFISQDYSYAPVIAAEEARRLSRFVMDCGYIPVSPVLLFHGVGDNHKEYDTILDMCKTLIDTCFEVWEFGPNPPRGRGRLIEREYAGKRGRLVRQKERDYQEWFDRRY